MEKNVGQSSSNKINSLAIIISFLFLFLLFLIGWYQQPGTYVWGLYTSIDGQFAEWYSKALAQWSVPFQISNMNPFEGMGSLFFPNNIWTSPGDLALALPVPQTWTYLLSYSFYLLEVCLSIYFLGRIFLSRVQSIIATQIFAFFLFPPFTNYTHALSFFSAAPFNAHLMALLNFNLVFFAALGKKSWALNFGITFLIVAFLAIAFYSGPMTFLTYLPFYGIFAAGIFIQQLLQTERRIRFLIWKIAPLVLLLIMTWILDVSSYINGTEKFVSRRLTSFSPFYVFPYDNTGVIFIFQALAFLGGILSCFIKRYRWVAFSFVLICLIPGIHYFLIVSNLIPRLSLLSPTFFLWTSYCFCALFFVIFFDVCLKALQRLLLPVIPFLSQLTTKRMALVSPFIIPLIAFYFFITIKMFAPCPVPPTEKTAIVAHLEKTIKLEPGSLFKGYAASYLGAEGGGIRPHLDVQSQQFDDILYVKAREYLKTNYNNWHMFSDLWGYGIPTFEEYGQWITIPLYKFVAELLSKPGAGLWTSNIYLFSLDYSILKVLGVRFIITDSVLNDPQIHQTTKIEKPGAAPLYLYEIKDPNLGNYSPTHVINISSAPAIFDLFKQHHFNFEDSVVLQDKTVPTNLYKVNNSSFAFDVNQVKVKATSKGYSLVVLPVQFSHCYKIRSKIPSDIKVMRANVVQTAILFKNHLDVDLVFDFGVTRNAECRKQDINDIKLLGLTND